MKMEMNELIIWKSRAEVDEEKLNENADFC